MTSPAGGVRAGPALGGAKSTAQSSRASRCIYARQVRHTCVCAAGSARAARHRRLGWGRGRGNGTCGDCLQLGAFLVDVEDGGEHLSVGVKRGLRPRHTRLEPAAQRAVAHHPPDLRRELRLIRAEQPVVLVTHVQVGATHRDDRQPAAQRLHQRAAVRLVMRCGHVELRSSQHARHLYSGARVKWRPVRGGVVYQAQMRAHAHAAREPDAPARGPPGPGRRRYLEGAPRTREPATRGRRSQLRTAPVRARRRLPQAPAPADARYYPPRTCLARGGPRLARTTCRGVHGAVFAARGVRREAAWLICSPSGRSQGGGGGAAGA